MTTWRLARCLSPLAAWVALAGCASSGSVTDTLDAGPLRLQQVQQRSGLQITVNSSSGVTFYTLRLSHHGQPVQVPDAGGGRLQPTPDARQGWLLTGAPRPAALLATDRWVLVTEQDGRPRVQEIAPGGTRWRWLAADGEPPLADAAVAGGHGGTRTERQPLALAGGRRLLLDDAVVLDLATLRALPLGGTLPAGYQAHGTGVLSLAPDGSAVAELAIGAANTERDALLRVRAVGGPQQTLLPLDWTAYTEAGGQRLDPDEIVRRHVRWRPGLDGAPAQLLLSPPAVHTPWHSRFELGARAPQADGGPRPRFTLWPVRPSALPAAVAQALAPDFQPLPARPGEPPASQQVRLALKAPAVEVVLRLEGQRLVIDSDGHDNPAWAQSLVLRLGEQLEAALREGRWQGHLAMR